MKFVMLPLKKKKRKYTDTTVEYIIRASISRALLARRGKLICIYPMLNVSRPSNTPTWIVSLPCQHEA